MKQENERSRSNAKTLVKALSRRPAVGPYLLSLFVSGCTPRSLRAIQNIRAFCEARLHGCYELKVIDVYQHPEEVRREQVVVTPTLIRKMPTPLRMLIGDMSDEDGLLSGLGVVPGEATL